MLVRPIVVILWMVVTAIAIPSPSYIAATENGKATPRHSYKYIIDDDNGVEQGKVETRSDELATGQYYVNGEQSSTDVKYFTDEWGYHPMVKYSASSGHSMANTQLALSEHVAQARVNDTNSTDDTQMIEPWSPNNFAIREITNDNEKVLKPYIEEVSESRATEGMNNTSLTTLEETRIIDNSGSFGQRIPNTQNSASTLPRQNETHHTTLELPHTSQSIIHHTVNLSPVITTKNSSSHHNSSVYNYETTLESIRKLFNMEAKEEINYKDPRNPQVFHREFASNQLAHQKHSYPVSGDNIDVQLLEKPPPQVSRTFSKPIVVAEVPNSEPFEYNTTFHCNDLTDDSTGSITSFTIDKTIPLTPAPSTLLSDTAVLVTPKIHSYSPITTSSVILNPIQAGVALMNAGEADFISSDTEQQLKLVSFNASASKEMEKLSSKSIVHPGLIIGTSDEAYGDEISKFNGRAAGIGTASYQTVEIQNSRELYDNNPVEEIHYPAEMAPQVVTINQLSPKYLNIPVYKNPRQVEQGKTYVDTVNANFGYQSILDRPELLLQELQTSPEAPPSTRLASHPDRQEKNNANALVNPMKHLENYVASKNLHGIKFPKEKATDEISFYPDARMKENHIYPEFESEKVFQNMQVNAQQTGMSLESGKRVKNNSQSNTKSSLQKLLTEEKQQNVYGHSTRIISTVPPTEIEKIEMKGISREIEKAIRQYSLSEDIGRSTIYIHIPTEDDSLLDIGNYDSQTIRGPQKSSETDVLNGKKLQEQHIVNPHQDTSQFYPFPEERVLEKAVTALNPYPKPIEKSLPQPVHKLLPHLSPLHISQPYPVEKIVEKQTPLQEPHPLETLTKPLELTNYIESTIHIPYGVQYGVSYQQIMNPPTNNLYDSNPGEPQMQTNGSDHLFQGYYLNKPVVPMKNAQLELTKRYGSLNQLSNNKQLQPQVQQPLQQSAPPIYLKKIHFTNQFVLPLHSRSIDHHIPSHRNLVYRAIDKGANKNLEYIGPVPLPQHALNLHQRNQLVHPLHQETLRFLTTVARSTGAGNLRRARLPDVHYQSRTSNFRQSKMEYGFKPPMVPSVQYDEQTATRVEN
ncbi:uncharacterized protein [Fopius arisanus]|uniref:LCP16 protein ( 17protein ) n=1 Tax=Fopius arisanus TaxID=64838 RepID=A0A0C9R7E8_9HYME|nr:PREDICTED: uncharacterized protein LOC105273905 [Fopius arisanus]